MDRDEFDWGIIVMEIRVLKEQEMRELFSMREAIVCAKDALRIYAAGGADIPLRVNIPVEAAGGQALYMPGYVEAEEALGIKIVSVYPENVERGISNVPATMILMNVETGEVCGLLDGTWLTRQRTGATAGAATDLLARKDAKIGALIGTGGQAETQLEAMMTVRNLETVWVYDISSERCREFCEKMTIQFAGRFSTKILPAASSDEAICGADIITAVTTSKRPVFDGTKVKAGAHVNGVGAFTAEMLELPEEIITRADLVVADTIHGVLHEAGDLMAALAKGVITESDLLEFGKLVADPELGRKKEEEVTLFKTVGSGVLDVMTAKRIYKKAVAEGKGQIV